MLIILSCHPDNNPGKGLSLENASDLDVYFYSSEIFETGHFPDTLLPEVRPLGLQFIMANGASGKFVDPNWEEIFDRLPQNKFTMFVLSAEIVDNTEWEEIRNNNLTLRRFDISLDELESSDYTIRYEE